MKTKMHAPPFDGSCMDSAPHLSKDERGIITSALSKLVGFGTLLLQQVAVVSSGRSLNHS